MALNYTKGTLSHKSEVTSGVSTSGRSWARMTIMIDVPGFQGSITKIAFQVGTDRIDDVAKFNLGDKVEIGWSIYAREYNGRWYNNVDLVSIKAQDGQTAAQAPAAAPVQEEVTVEDAPENDLPF